MPLRQKLLTAIRSRDASSFEPLALQCFARQYERNPDYRRFCEQQGVTPDSLTRWQQIPAVVTDVFKLRSATTYCGEAPPAAEFHTSGTTGSAVGRHQFDELDLYRASVIHGYRHCGPPLTEALFFLSPPARLRPHSSLVKMFDFLREDRDLLQDVFLETDSGTFEITSLEKAIRWGRPVGLLGTAIQFLKLFDQLGARCMRLPRGSYAVETGGYKATDISIEKPDLYALFSEKLGLADSAVWNEYSMTELSSQFYTHGLENAHTGPPWLRHRIIHPETLQEVAPGEVGYLVLYDLANYDSFIAIQTQDFATATDDGFILIGRDPSALPRGCSRALS